MVDEKMRQVAMDEGTRQWTPEDDLHSVRKDLQRRLGTQRARRNALHQGPSAAARTGPGRGTQIAQITLSYAELLRALALAAADQRGVTLTHTTDNVYLKVADAGEGNTAADGIAALVDLELAVRDRLEASVARRYLALHGPDHLVGGDEEVANDPEDGSTERMAA